MLKYWVYLLIGLLSAVAATAGGKTLQTFVLQDYVNHAWTNELVHYDLAFQTSTCWPNGLRLMDETGAPVPVQLSRTTAYTDGSLKSATLWFVTTLPANGTRTYALTGGVKGDRPAKYATDLVLKKGNNCLQLLTTNTGVQVLFGSRIYKTPQPSAKMIAPLQAVRLRGGAWTGRGWFETNHRCTGYTATLSENGPVFKQVVIRYTFAKPAGWTREGDLYYQMTVRLVAGQEVAYVTEDFNLGDPVKYQPPSFKDEKQEMMWDWWSWKPQQAEDNFCFSFLAGGTFAPTHARYIAHTSTDPERGVTDGYSSYRETEYALQFTKNRLEFMLNARTDFEPNQALEYAMYRKADPNSNIIALLPCQPAKWRNPDILPHEPEFIQQITDAADFRIYSAPGDLFVRAPLHLGHREWALATLKNPGIITDAVDNTVMAGMIKKYGVYPLDLVKDWELAWPDPNATVRPDGGAVDKEYAVLTEQLDGFIHTALAWPNIAERTGINSFPMEVATRAEKALALLTSDRLTAAQRTALRARIAFLNSVLWDDAVLPPRKAGYGWGSLNMPVAVYHGRTRAALVMKKLGQKSADPHIAIAAKFFKYQVSSWFSPDGSPLSNPHYMGIGAEPLLAVAPILQEAGYLKSIKETFPNFYNFAQFMVDMSQPKDIRFGKRISPTEGDAYWEVPHIPAAVAPLFKDSDPQLYRNLLWAAGQSETPPADLKSVAYPGFGAFLHHKVGDPEESYLLLRMGNFTIDHTRSDAGSMIWYARGVPLTMHFATMYTPYMSESWLFSGLSFNHQEHTTPVPCPGKGQPGCFYTGKAWYEHTTEPNTMLDYRSDPTDTNIGDMHGQIRAFATQPGADYLQGGAVRHRFAKMPYMYGAQLSVQPLQANTVLENYDTKEPFTWTRQFAFVKDASASGPNYLVITDDLAGNTELEPAFNYWCLATDVKEMGKRQYHFTGQFGIDCDMFVLQPGEGRVQLGEWKHTQAFLVGNPGLEELQKFVRVYGKPDGKGFSVVLFPRKANEPQPKVETLADGKLIKVILPDQTHWIVLSKEPVTVQDGPVKITGTAAVVKQWQDGRVQITLLAGGEASCGTETLKSDGQKSLESAKR
ncbi:MAG: hypothetical protein ACYDBB_09130 [Armatimonadota bacterium]